MTQCRFISFHTHRVIFWNRLILLDLRPTTKPTMKRPANEAAARMVVRQAEGLKQVSLGRSPRSRNHRDRIEP